MTPSVLCVRPLRMQSWQSGFGLTLMSEASPDQELQPLFGGSWRTCQRSGHTGGSAVGDFLAWLVGEKGQLAVAGALGGLVRWLSLRESRRDGLISVIVGAICALYLGPVAVPVIEQLIGRIVIEPASRAGLSGFIIGLGGIVATGVVLDVWHAWRRRLRGETDATRRDP